MKVQVNVIGFVLILVLLLSLTSSMLLYTMPYVEEQRQRVLFERAQKAFDQSNPDSLPRLMRYVAKYGGSQSFRLEVGGEWKIDQSLNYLEFSFRSRLSDRLGSGWIALPDERGRIATCPPSPGIVGIDSPAAVCARAVGIGEEFNVTYRLYFRPLCERVEAGRCLGKSYEVLLRSDAQHFATQRIWINLLGEESVATKTTIRVGIKPG